MIGLYAERRASFMLDEQRQSIDGNRVVQNTAPKNSSIAARTRGLSSGVTLPVSVIWKRNASKT